MTDQNGIAEIIEAVLATLPEKTYYRIGEVARLSGVKAHVLRYWENEFPLHPRKSTSGQRLYKKSDIELILRIKDLLWRRKYTVAGARRAIHRPDLEGIEDLQEAGELPQIDVLREGLLKIRARARDLRAQVSGATLETGPRRHP